MPFQARCGNLTDHRTELHNCPAEGNNLTIPRYQINRVRKPTLSEYSRYFFDEDAKYQIVIISTLVCLNLPEGVCFLNL